MQQFTLAVFALFAGGALAHSVHHIKRVGDLNGTITTNASLVDDSHVPVFKAETCVCATPICDSRMDAASICGCQQAAKLACYMASQGACEKPADNACGSTTT